MGIEDKEKSVEQVLAEYVAERGLQGLNDGSEIQTNGMAFILGAYPRMQEVASEFSTKIADGLASEQFEPASDKGLEDINQALKIAVTNSLKGTTNEAKFTEDLTEELKKEFPEDKLLGIVDGLALKLKEKEEKIASLPAEFRNGDIANMHKQDILDIKEALHRIDLSDADKSGKISIGELAHSLSVPDVEALKQR